MSKPKHHVRDSICATRAPYREGRKNKAVKVYTVQQESKYLLVQGIPAVGAKDQLLALFGGHGPIAEHRMLDDYPSEQFTEVCLIKFQRIQSARHAKRQLDDWSFYGGVLHVCYAPEYESVQETREKLQDRRKAVATKVRQYSQDGTYESNVGGDAVHSNSNVVTGSTQASTNMAITQSETPQAGTHIAHQTVPNHYAIQQNQTTSSSHMVQHHNSNWSTASYSHVTHNQHSNWSATSNSHMTSNHNSNWSTGPDSHAGYSSAKPSDNRLASQASSTTEEVQLCLPPPPKQMKFSVFPEPRQRIQELGRVPSAHAGLPPGFDARTDQPTGVSLAEYLARKGPNERIQEQEDESEEKSVQEIIDENLKKSSIVVKEMPKKISVPKFVPRQAQARFKLKSGPGVATKAVSVTATDTVNKELKKNAFTLGQPQGAVDLEDHIRVRPGPQEVSLQKSVKEIRDKLTEVTKSSVLPKSTKDDDTDSQKSCPNRAK